MHWLYRSSHVRDDIIKRYRLQADRAFFFTVNCGGGVSPGMPAADVPASYLSIHLSVGLVIFDSAFAAEVTEKIVRGEQCVVSMFKQPDNGYVL